MEEIFIKENSSKKHYEGMEEQISKEYLTSGGGIL